MPDLNLIDEGGIEETTTPSAPMPSKRRSGGGGSLNKILMSVLVLLIIGTALFYSYKKGKFPFKKKAPVTVVQEETFPDTQPTASSQNAQQAVQSQDTTNVPLLETPMVEDTSKNTETKLVKTTGASKNSMAESATLQKLSDMQGNYTVQVSAFREKKQANEIVGRLEDAGYPAYVETLPMKGVSWYTVRIGHYPSRNDAKKAVSDFALEIQSNYWIDRVRNK
jgi:septal ring-binding cell division protein DamX